MKIGKGDEFDACQVVILRPAAFFLPCYHVMNKYKQSNIHVKKKDTTSE